METYRLHELLPLCKPLDRIKRKTWCRGTFIIVPYTQYEAMYIYSYLESPPKLFKMYLNIDEILCDDWMRFE